MPFITARIPKQREMYSYRCDPALVAGCRATGAPNVSTSGETLCCYPGVKVEPLEHTTPQGEAAKIGLIILAVGTMFGLAVLTRQWTSRTPRNNAVTHKRKAP